MNQEKAVDNPWVISAPALRGVKRKSGPDAMQNDVKYRKVFMSYYTCTAHTNQTNTEYHLDRPGCFKAAQQMRNKYGPGVDVDLDRHLLIIYDDIFVMKDLYAWFLIEQINGIKRMECPGCLNNQEGSEGHTVCLMNFGDAVDEYADRASADISLETMTGVYCEFLKLINMRHSPYLYTIAQCCQRYLHVEVKLHEYVCEDGRYCPTILDILFKKSFESYQELS